MNTILLVISIAAVAIAAVTSWVAVRLWREERLRSDVRVALLEELSRPATGAAVPLAGELFHTPAERPAWPRRIAIAAGVFAAVAVGVLGFNAIDRDATRQATTVAVAQRPLELLSLGHAQEAGMLVVSGLVQNPAEGTSRSRVVATAVLLDAAGSTVGDGRSPLDIVRLEPGQESPFVIRVPARGPVARYRVSFREGDDRPLPHVDRRDASLARKEAP